MKPEFKNHLYLLVFAFFIVMCHKYHTFRDSDVYHLMAPPSSLAFQTLGFYTFCRRELYRLMARGTFQTTNNRGGVKTSSQT